MFHKVFSAGIFLKAFRSMSIGREERLGPRYILEKKVRIGQIQVDSGQMEAVTHLQTLYEEIENYSPGVILKYLHSSPPKGIYLYGSVGAGKTMLMDVFYSSAKTDLKKRVHFNDFMTNVHSQIHASRHRENNPNRKIESWNSFKPISKKILRSCWLLCFDEFQPTQCLSLFSSSMQNFFGMKCLASNPVHIHPIIPKVTDIGDAMILKGLFTELFSNGMVMIATSNRAPDDLYKGGLQRSNFVPFIDVLKKHCKVVNLNGPDYRRESSPGLGTRYFIGQAEEQNARMDEAFKFLCKSQSENSPKSFNFLGRDVTFKKTCGRILDATFSELCENPLGMADYLQIAKNFDTIFIRNVPRMSLNYRNQARRFTILIDTLYDQRVRIVVSAAASPQHLFSASYKKDDSDSDRNLMDDLNIEKGSVNAKTSFFSGTEEIYAFDRTISRLIEMSSDSYWELNER